MAEGVMRKNINKKINYGEEEEKQIKAHMKKYNIPRGDAIRALRGRLSNTSPKGIKSRKKRTKEEVRKLDEKNTRKSKLYKSIMFPKKKK